MFNFSPGPENGEFCGDSGIKKVSRDLAVVCIKKGRGPKAVI